MKVLKHPPKLKYQTRSGQCSFITQVKGIFLSRLFHISFSFIPFVQDELEVTEIGRHKIECQETSGKLQAIFYYTKKSAGFVICGQEQDVDGGPGVIPEHLAKKLRLYDKTKLKNEGKNHASKQYNFHQKRICSSSALTKFETSRGNFIVESQERVYSGPRPPGEGCDTQEVQKETEDFFSGAQDSFSTTGEEHFILIF